MIIGCLFGWLAFDKSGDDELVWNHTTGSLISADA
jgi:hypothetical protein